MFSNSIIKVQDSRVKQRCYSAALNSAAIFLLLMKLKLGNDLEWLVLHTKLHEN
jgi:hypothetical protein